MPTLNWIGKDAVVEHHKEVPYHLLHCNPDLSVGEAGSGNLLIQGDNLLALKALLPYYAGQVKCIYIDPPYNTGEENWVYNDNVNSPEIQAWLGQVVGKEAEDLSRHDKWLCMMYPRLVLLQQFLREDGVIIVAIDDNELSDLQSLLDEIFSKSNWIATLVWEKTRKNDAKFFSVGHDYMLVFAKNKEHLRTSKTVWRETKPGAMEIMQEYGRLRLLHGKDDKAVENDLREWYRSLPDSHPSKRLSRYKHVDNNGVWRDRDISWPGGGGPRYDVIHPATGKPCKIPERGWGFANTNAMQEQIALGLVVFREDHTEPPIRKAYLNEVQVTLDQKDFQMSGALADEPTNDEVGLQVMPSVIYRHTQPSVRLLRKILGKKVFNNPKDHEVLARLFRYITKPGDIILDSFAGSGSTGHAVLQVNHDDFSERKFILIEMENEVARTITAERLKRVIQGYRFTGTNKTDLFSERLTVTAFKRSEKILGEIEAIKELERGSYNGFEVKIEGGQIILRGKRKIEGATPGLGGGFRFCELGDTLFDAQGQIRSDVTFSELAQHIFFTETGEPLLVTNDSSPLLGISNSVAVYLLYNGILGDKSKNGGNILTRAVFANLPPYDGLKVIYGQGCMLSQTNLQKQQIRFRQIPYEVKGR